MNEQQEGIDHFTLTSTQVECLQSFKESHCLGEECPEVASWCFQESRGRCVKGEALVLPGAAE